MRREPLWGETAGAEVVAALDPGIPSDLDRTPDVLVVGGGCVGLATAAQCRRAGLGGVVVLERGRLAGGPSGGGAGVLAPEPHVWTDPPALVELGRNSLALTRELDAEWEGALGVTTLECLVVGWRVDDAPMPLVAPVEVLDPRAVQAREPEVVVTKEALLIGGQARVHPLRFAHALSRRAGTVATGVEVAHMAIEDERVVSVHTSAGEFSPGTVVFATGMAPRPYVSVRHHVVKGHLLATEALPIRITAQVVTPWGGALPLENGRLLSGGTFEEDDDSAEVRDVVVEAIRRGLGRVIPAARDVTVSHAWCCFRPAAPDLVPVVDRVPGTTNAWFTSGHYRTGFLMAAATGRALAQWIAAGSPPAEVRPFGLARFDDRRLS